MIVANPTLYPACREPRTEERRAYPELSISAFSSPNPSPFDFKLSTVNLFSFLDALDAASSLSPLSATHTKNTRGGGTSQASAKNSNRNPSVFNCFSRISPPSTLNFQPSTVFPRESISISIHGIYTPFVFMLLRTLLHRQNCYLQPFHAFPHSFRKTPGVGYPPPRHRRTTPIAVPPASTFNFRLSTASMHLPPP
jgi:hypothetical protein